MGLTPNGNQRLFKREEIKAALMQAGYGQQEKGTKNQLKEDMGEKYNDHIYEIFVQAIDRKLPGFYDLLTFINNQWNPNWEEVSWLMPDGFKVQCKPTSSDWEEFTLFNQLKVTAKVSGVKKEKQALVLYVGFIHAVDAFIAREMIRRCDFEIITIHDAFKCHPNNAYKMQKTYTDILADINAMNLLELFIFQITGIMPENIKGDLRYEDIKQTLYSIC